MGFYVGYASKYLSCICLNSKECFKGEKLPGDMELAQFTFKRVGKKIIQNISKKRLYIILRRLWFVILTLSYSLSFSSLLCIFPHAISVHHKKFEIVHIGDIWDYHQNNSERLTSPFQSQPLGNRGQNSINNQTSIWRVKIIKISVGLEEGKCNAAFQHI